MSEHAPKTNSPDKTPAQLGAELTPEQVDEYYYDLRRNPEDDRHPQAQAAIESVYGTLDEEGKHKDAVRFPAESTKDFIDRNHLAQVYGHYSKPGNEAQRFMFENETIVPSLRTGDIEREFHTERLAEVNRQLGDHALAAQGTRWQRLKRSFTGPRKVSEANLKRELAFSEGRLTVLPTEEESQAQAKASYRRNEEFIRGRAESDNIQRELRLRRESTEAAPEKSVE